MNLRIKPLFLLLSLALSSFSYGQMEDYDYQRELLGISDQWHKIILPTDLYAKTGQGLHDLRIYGINAAKDTIEAPYLLRYSIEKKTSKRVSFKLINSSFHDKGYYFTFEIPTQEPINQIQLDFAEANFDWRVTLEGSQNQQEWFRVVENYRILSIKNEQTDFKFTNVSIPTSKYRYFRFLINVDEKPEMIGASIRQNTTEPETLRDYDIRNFKLSENKQTNETEIDIDLQVPGRISRLSLAVLDSFDYVRPIAIKYLVDSVNTEQGWKYNYRPLTSGTLTSEGTNEFQFSNTTLQKLKVVISNRANQPLTIDSVKVQGFKYELLTRFTEPASYYLVYGNTNASKSSYDINRFKENIPKELVALTLGNEVAIAKKEVPVVEPLFSNKKWLWAIMVLVILVLGGFTLHMIRKK